MAEHLAGPMMIDRRHGGEAVAGVLRAAGERLVRDRELIAREILEASAAMGADALDPVSAAYAGAALGEYAAHVGDLLASSRVVHRGLGLPGSCSACVKRAAGDGVALELVQRRVRRAHGFLLAIVLADLARHADTVEELASATIMASNSLLEDLDETLELVAETYNQERQRRAEGCSGVSLEAIAAVLDRRETSALAASRRLRHDLERQHVGLCAWSEDLVLEVSSRTVLLEALERVADALGGQARLHFPMGDTVAAAWVSLAKAPDMCALAHVRLGECGHRLRVTTGEPAYGLAGFRSSHLQALAVRRAVRLSGIPASTVTRYDDIALLCLASGDLEQTQEFVRRQLGPLSANDEQIRRLADTLRVYLDEHASRSRTAKRLGIHENTVSNRIRQAEQLLERYVTQDTFNLQVALRLAALVTDRAS